MVLAQKRKARKQRGRFCIILVELGMELGIKQIRLRVHCKISDEIRYSIVSQYGH